VSGVRRRRVDVGAAVLVAVTLCALAGCGSGSEPSAGAPVDLEGAASSESAGSDASAQDTSTPSERDVADQHVDLGSFADRPQAAAVGEFYEALWTSYQKGAVTPALTRLTTDSALATFRDRVEEYRKRGHTVADLTAARVTQVQGAAVFVCMASASYQRREVRTGAAVDPPEEGFTQYQVRLQRARPPWKVDTISGTKNVPCGKAAS
jgi:hypothetical protein